MDRIRIRATRYVSIISITPFPPSLLLPDVVALMMGTILIAISILSGAILAAVVLRGAGVVGHHSPPIEDAENAPAMAAAASAYTVADTIVVGTEVGADEDIQPAF